MILAPGALAVALIWHQHQPFYPKRPGENVYTQPWVRLHAARDYVRMATAAARHRGVKVTINLTPSLLVQLEDLAGGATDRQMVLSGIDARILTISQKREIHRTFFAAGRELRKPLPRYEALSRLPFERFTTRDWRDLQIFFNLAWLSPEVQREPAIAALIRKGASYSENDKLLVLRRHHELVREVIPTHVRLEKAGRIEVTTSPYAHPILPLLVDSDVASTSLPPGTPLPGRFSYPDDAAEQVRLGLEAYRRVFGKAPGGMWPADLAVSQAIMPLFRQAGIRWIAADESILGRTLGTSLRAGGSLTRPDLLAGLWRAQDGPAVVFRDRELSDRIAYSYASWEPRKAARDLAARLRGIGSRLPAAKPSLLAIALDGENIWERYPGNGDAFLDALYGALERDRSLRLTTPGEVFGKAAGTVLPGPIAAGSRVGGTFRAWIGEREKNTAWDLLRQAREAVAGHASSRGRTRAHEDAMAALRAAEGSDWFRWYGKDSGRDAGFDAAFRDSRHEAGFDAAFRDYLATAYRAISREVPEDVLRPAGFTPPAPRPGPISPPVDGRGGPAWEGAISARRPGGTSERRPGGASAGIVRAFEGVQVGSDDRNLYLAARFHGRPSGTTVLLGFPGRPGGVSRHGVPFRVQAILDLQPKASPSVQILGDPPASRPVRAAWGSSRLEAAVPWSALGARGGEDLAVTFLELGAMPYPDLPVHLAVPALPDRAAAAFADPRGDAIQPLDLVRFGVEEEASDWVFVWTFGGSLAAGLGAGRLEAYVATEPGPPIAGGVPLVPGRPARAVLPWRLVCVADARRAGYLSPPAAGEPTRARMWVDPERGTVSVAVPKRALPGTPRLWSYLAGSVGPDGSFADLVGLAPERLLEYLVPD